MPHIEHTVTFFCVTTCSNFSSSPMQDFRHAEKVYFLGWSICNGHGGNASWNVWVHTPIIQTMLCTKCVWIFEWPIRYSGRNTFFARCYGFRAVFFVLLLLFIRSRENWVDVRGTQCIHEHSKAGSYTCCQARRLS